MKMELETKYAVGQEVFPIYEDRANNDFYCTDTAWFIMFDDDKSKRDGWNWTKIVPYKIEEVRVTVTERGTTVLYLMRGILFKEKNIFESYELASAAIDEREKNPYSY